LQKSDLLKVISNWIDRELQGFDETADDWDGYLHFILKKYSTQYEPPPDMWTEIKAKVQREVVLNQVQSCGP
jgi:hypothetical protein